MAMLLRSFGIIYALLLMSTEGKSQDMSGAFRGSDDADGARGIQQNC